VVEGRTMGLGWDGVKEWSVLCASDSNMRGGKDWRRSNPSCFTNIFCCLHIYNLVQRHINKSLLICIRGENSYPFFLQLTFSRGNILSLPTFNLSSCRIGEIFHEGWFNILPHWNF
jgi:hypothetical protein